VVAGEAKLDITDRDGRAAVAGVVLAAGLGTRLLPLTRMRPKPLCPIDGVPLVDLALARVATVAARRAVNIHHGRALLESHLYGRVHLSIEEGRPLGTAGALGRLKEWIGGRPTVVVNGDTWTTAPLEPLLADWDGERIRLLVVRPTAGGLGDRPRLAGALLPWSEVQRFDATPSGLWEVSWHAAIADGRLEVVAADAPFIDCGTPASYLAANLHVSGGAPVIGKAAIVDGTVDRTVLWPGAIVRRGERLEHAIRVGELTTVYVR
jgi:MurNAc alpha-1-phosphate uridylyltransferase